MVLKFGAEIFLEKTADTNLIYWSLDQKRHIRDIVCKCTDSTEKSK